MVKLNLSHQGGRGGGGSKGAESVRTDFNFHEFSWYLSKTL